MIAERAAALSVARVSDAGAFRDLEREWDALYERSPARSVFLRWGWLYAWWEAFGEGHQLRIYAARDAAGRLVGLAPLCRRVEPSPWPIRVLTFLGTERVSSDFMDVLVAPELEAEASSALWDAIARDASDVDWIRWCDILDSSVVARRIVPVAREAGWPVEDRLAEYCPFVTLPDSLETLLARRGKSLRDQYRRSARKLEAAGTTIAVDTDAATLPEALDSLYRLHEERWRRKGREGNFRDGRVRRFHERVVRAFAPRGLLRLYRLRVADRTFAVLYALDDRGVLSYYQAGFDPAPPDSSMKPHDYSPGTVLIGTAMEDAIRRGRTEFDFLRGHEPAKFRWTDDYRVTRTMTVIPRGRWRGRAAMAAVRANRGARGLARRLLRRPSLPAPPPAPGGGR
ncbi:MAG TPA: GNAT family N-acetyltransferase [Acidobacteriota bacterium]|nr:GNAT family N-acetyltransferase [Acidobacteriota bacterium]